MGVMIKQPINPLGEAILRRDADIGTLGKIICELELELIELKLKLEEEGK